MARTTWSARQTKKATLTQTHAHLFCGFTATIRAGYVGWEEEEEEEIGSRGKKRGGGGGGAACDGQRERPRVAALRMRSDFAVDCFTDALAEQRRHATHSDSASHPLYR